MMTTCEENYDAVQRLIDAERHEEAIMALEKLIAQSDGHVEAHFDLGNLYYASGNKEKALAHYEQAAKLAPDNPAYLKNLADLLYAENTSINRVLGLYEKILILKPDDLQTLIIKGHICVSQKRFEDAKKCYQSVLDLQPWNEEATAFLEKLKNNDNQLGNQLEAEASYERCHELLKSGRVKESMAGLRAIISQFPDFAVAHNDLGVLYYQQGDKGRCLEHYEKAYQIQPDNPNYKKNIADFYLIEQGEIEKALELYSSVLNDNPEDVEALLAAGHLCQSMHKIDSARIFYERILDIEPWNLEASERMDQLNTL